MERIISIILRPKQTEILSFAFAFALLCAGCSAKTDPGRPKPVAELDAQFPTVVLSQIPSVKQPSAPLNVAFKPELKLQIVRDIRADQVLLRHAGREVRAMGDVTLGVRYALVKAFRQRGFSIKDGAALELKLSISRWQAVFDNSLRADAVVQAELVGPAGDNVFSGVFEGEAVSDAQRIFDRDVEAVMGQAMGDALSKLLANEKLIETATAY